MAEVREEEKWQFGGGVEVVDMTVRAVMSSLLRSCSSSEIVPMAHGDPSRFPSFRPPEKAVEAVIAGLRSANFNSYSTTSGLLSARSAVAEYLSGSLPQKIRADDVYVTTGCSQAIHVMLAVLARPGANILLPKPGYPYYESRASFSNLQVRHFPLLQDRGWEIDLESVQALSDHNTVAMVLINPGNPTGCVYSRAHLHEVAQTARKLGILVIADEVYGRLTFGSNPFVPMGVFASVAPVVTLGSISKRWCVPGWRIGWIAINDPNAVLKKSGLTKNIADYLNLSSDSTTFIQGALPCILKQTEEDYFAKIVNVLREAADMCCKKVEEIPCITCPNKPEGAMSFMVKLNVSLLDDITDDSDFCLKLAKEESVILLPGSAVGMKNWLRITFSIEPSILEDGLAKLKAFCGRHSKKQ